MKLTRDLCIASAFAGALISLACRSARTLGVHTVGSPTDAEVRSACEGLVAYCGAYETNEEKHYVIHHVEADRAPGLMGTNRTRLATVTATRLILRPIDLPAGVAEWTVEFERVGE